MSYMHVFREQAREVILSYADEALRRGKPHIAHSEMQMADAAIEGSIDNGATIQALYKACYQETEA